MSSLQEKIKKYKYVKNVPSETWGNIKGFAKKMTTPRQATQKQFEDAFGASPTRFTPGEKKRASNLSRFMNTKR